MSLTTKELTDLHAQSDLIFSQAQVEAALDKMAAEISADTNKSNPIIMCVMNGGLIPAGLLLPRLQFPLRVDYLHATRYRERTFGTDLQWKKSHEVSVEGQTVIVVDDILDEGHTLNAIKDHLLTAGAHKVYAAVLIEKELSIEKPIKADYVGLIAPNRYLYGYGMDYKGYWRNANGIWALNKSLL